MLAKEVLLLIIPIASIVIIMLLADRLGNNMSANHQQTITNEGPDAYLKESGSSASCPEAFKEHRCATANTPVMGGLDFVQYFETIPIQATLAILNSPFGNPQFTADYSGYSFLFQTQENKDKFTEAPSQFIPQYGGFCAWAVAGELDETVHPWSADCFGPPGNRSVWSIINHKLYFFRFEEAKANFLSDSKQFIKTGDIRWDKWFGDRPEAYFDTVCAAELHLFADRILKY